MTCRPWWVSKFLPLADSPRLFVPGCGTVLEAESPDFGLNNCMPQKLLVATQNRLTSMGLELNLTLDILSLAYNISAEQGSGTPEMKLALALSTMGRARRKGEDVAQVIIRNGRCPDGKTGPGCRYGRIHGASGIDSAPFDRFTASSQAPTVEEVSIAAFAMSGQAGDAGDPGNAARGADDQWGPETLERALAKMRDYATHRDYWVGAIPGVHPLSLHLFRHRPEVVPGSPEDRHLQAALEAELRQNVANLDVVRTPDGFKSLNPCIEAEPGKPTNVVVAAVLGVLGASAVAIGVLGAVNRENLAFLGRMFRR